MRIGIDLGGTNIKAGLVNDKLEIVKKMSIPTNADRPTSEIMHDMAKLAIDVVREAGYTMDDVESIGIGSPGTCDSKNGILVYANNIKFFNAPMRAEIQKYINKPVYIDNDANCAAYGEYLVLDKKPAVFAAVTLGTGIGGGVVIDGHVFRGFNGTAPELGHTTLDMNGEKCNCGRVGCFEKYASATALISQTKAAIEKNPDSILAKVAEKEGKVSGRTAFLAEREGCPICKAVADKYIEYLGIGLVNVINNFAPDVVCIGGGVCGEGARILDPVKAYCAEHIYCKYVEQTEVRIAKLGNDAGIIGAAMLDE